MINITMTPVAVHYIKRYRPILNSLAAMNCQRYQFSVRIMFLKNHFTGSVFRKMSAPPQEKS